MGTVGIIVVYAVILGGMWFLLMRPQKKEQKRIQAMLADMEIGDTALTTSGFYGVIIDITDDDVIVEFGKIRIAVFLSRRLRSLRLRSQVLNKRKNETGRSVTLSGLLFYASNEPKSVFARDLGDCRDNLRNSQSVFLIGLDRMCLKKYNF